MLLIFKLLKNIEVYFKNCNIYFLLKIIIYKPYNNYNINLLLKNLFNILYNQAIDFKKLEK